MRRWFLAYAALFAALLASWGSFAQLTATGIGGGGFGAGGGGGCTPTGTQAIDASGVFKGVGNGTTTFGVTNVATTSTNDVIIAVVGNNRTNAQGSATTIAPGGVTGGGLTWINRSQFSFQSAGTGTPFETIEVWYAISAAALSASTITFTFNATMDNAAAGIFGVTNSNTTTPWDTNGSLPATGNSGATGGTTTTTPTVSGVSTSCTKAMLLMAAFSANTGAVPTDPQTAGSGGSGSWTVEFTQSEAGGANFTAAAAQYSVVSATQSGITTTFGTAWPSWIASTDAIQAAP